MRGINDDNNNNNNDNNNENYRQETKDTKPKKSKIQNLKVLNLNLGFWVLNHSWGSYQFQDQPLVPVKYQDRNIKTQDPRNLSMNYLDVRTYNNIKYSN